MKITLRKWGGGELELRPHHRAVVARASYPHSKRPRATTRVCMCSARRARASESADQTIPILYTINTAIQLYTAKVCVQPDGPKTRSDPLLHWQLSTHFFHSLHICPSLTVLVAHSGKWPFGTRGIILNRCSKLNSIWLKNISFFVKLIHFAEHFALESKCN